MPADFKAEPGSPKSPKSPKSPTNGSTKAKPAKGGCCGFLGGKKKKAFDQTLVVLRHSERRDYVDREWKFSEEGKAWPFDAPLTDRGVSLAQEVAKELAALHETANFCGVVTSPYRRCLETAAEVAKLLKLSVIIDQELGEVWGKEMPEEPCPFRTGVELKQMVEGLGIKARNPRLDESQGGGLKLFGKKFVKWPETLDDSKTRFLVRIRTYIEESLKDEKNYILVTHADAVAAALQMMQWGNADVQNLDFCARLIAQRTVQQKDKEKETQVYDQKFKLTTKAISAEIFVPENKTMEKFYEKEHMQNVQDKDEAAQKRKDIRTKTDALFGDCLKNLAAEIPESDDEGEEDAGQEIVANILQGTTDKSHYDPNSDRV